MNSNFPRDCPEEQVLLDFLAGELRPKVARYVGQHLTMCTDCALRVDQLSEDFVDVERATEVELPLPPLRLAVARARLREQQEAYEASRAADSHPDPVGATRARFAFVAAVAVLLIGAAAALNFVRDDPALTAEQVLDRARESIPANGIRPSMARYEVEIAQLEPVSVRRKHQLVIWTDPASGGYTSRLEDPDGSLRHAVWRRTTNGPAFAYDRAAGKAPIRIHRPARDRPPTLLASMGNGIDYDVLASGFARWLGERRWHPLQVSRDFALLASDDATVRLHRSADVILVVAQKQQGTLRAEVTLAVGAQSYEPYWLQIRFLSPEGESTFKIVQNEVRFIAASHLDTSVFEVRLPSSSVLQTRSAPVTRSPPEPARASPDPQLTEARVRHALHVAGACLGEPVEVVHRTDGTLELRGIVGGYEMKEAILKELIRSDTLDSLSVSIQTRDEAAAEAGQRPEFDEIPVARPRLEAARVRLRSEPVRDLLLAADLTAYFRLGDPRTPADWVGRSLSAFADGAVERAEELLRRAWALRRLAERYGPDSGESISPEVAALVREMCHDHLHGIGASAHASAEWTLPILSAIAKSRGLEEADLKTTSRTAAPGSSWTESFLTLFEAADGIHRDTLELLTVRQEVTDAPVGPDGTTDVTDVDRTLRRLLSTSLALGPEISRTADAFAAGSHPPPAAPLGRETTR